MKNHLIPSLIISILLISGCSSTQSLLVHAKDYEVVAEGKMNMQTDKRTARMFYIVSDAQTFEDLSQTGMLAAFELHKTYRYDLISVMIVPSRQLVRTEAYYTRVLYAADNKGATGLSGVDETLFTSGKWSVRSVEKILSDQEIEMFNLWYGNQYKFPNKNPASSLSYDRESLVDYIAKEFQIDMAEVMLPSFLHKVYKSADIKKWMTPEPK